jgi:dolichol-phosphate mannosyltransferase
MMIHPKHLSIVIPFHNEAENVFFVLTEVRAVLPNAEIIAVDDASTDGTWERICAIPDVTGLRLLRQAGQSGAIYLGLQQCTRDFCGLMDGDGQNDPANFLRLLERLNAGDVEVVCGCRERRADTWTRRVASRSANRIRHWFLRDGIQDTGCAQKIFPRAALALLVPFRGMHRYLPAFFKRAGLRLAEVPVCHRVRRSGLSKYGNWSRAIVGIRDLLGVQWLLHRSLPLAQVQMLTTGQEKNHPPEKNGAKHEPATVPVA